MATADDPLERLALRETELREKRAVLESGRGMMKLALRFFAGLAVAWAIVLAAHWVFFRPALAGARAHDRFLARHRLLGGGRAVLRIMRKRMPEMGDS